MQVLQKISAILSINLLSLLFMSQIYLPLLTLNFSIIGEETEKCGWICNKQKR